MSTPELAVAVELAPPLSPQALDPQALIVKALECNVPIDTMERLLALRDRLKAEQAREAYFAALARFQAKCPVIPKTKTAGQGNFAYKFAPLDVMVPITAPILEACGLSVTFQTRVLTEPVRALVITATCHHVAGHSESSDFTAPVNVTDRMNDIQKNGSARTYGMRYAYQQVLGIYTGDEDNDGKTGDTKPKEPFAPPRRKDEFREAVVAAVDVVRAAAEVPPRRKEPALSQAEELADVIVKIAERVTEPDESPLTDAELAALDAQDAKDAEQDTPPLSEPVISAAQVKRLYALIQAACEKRPKAVELLRSALHVKLMQTIGAKEFERIPKRLYNEVCDDWVKKGGPWALKHEQSA